MKIFTLENILARPLLCLGLSFLGVSICSGEKILFRKPIIFISHCPYPAKKDLLLAYAYALENPNLSEKFFFSAQRQIKKEECKEFKKALIHIQATH